ncbi:MAG: apolipoprotein acyltransferase, partial [Methylocystis sp.]
DGHTTAFENSIERLEKNVVDRLGVVSVEIDEKGGRIVEVIDSRLQDINHILTDARRDLDATLHGHAGELGQSLVSHISQISEELDSRLNQMERIIREGGGNVTRELAAAGELAAETIESRGALIVRELAQKRDELTQALQDSHASLNRALDEGAHDSIRSLIGMNEKIRHEMPGVLEKLGATNASLHDIIDQTGGGLIHLERELGERVHEFHTALTDLSGKVQELSSISSDTMRDAHQIVSALEARQLGLNQSAQKLAESQRALDVAFDQRKESLAQFVAVLDTKRYEFERAMEGFVHSMAHSIDVVESRAQDVGGVISATTDQAAQLIEQRFADVRAAAENERAQTAQSLRMAFSEATDEINRLFSETQKKFQGATGEIRGLAKEIHEEIEATREELRKGATELPREAAEQSAAFRRVVADQVKSLADITDMMSRTGRSLEAADTPVRRSQEPARVDQTKPRMSPPPIPQRAKSEPQGGWLSDLLERASRDDSVARAPIHNGTALERLTVDIARLVDDVAVSEVWRRYQRGEKGGLFNRRLYTQQGRQTFEEISRRYRVDHNFRMAMDQYIRNFEEKVVETTRNDRDGSRTLALLTADAGKVYTMLGHAAGRFD